MREVAQVVVARNEGYAKPIKVKRPLAGERVQHLQFVEKGNLITSLDFFSYLEKIKTNTDI